MQFLHKHHEDIAVIFTESEVTEYDLEYCPLCEAYTSIQRFETWSLVHCSSSYSEFVWSRINKTSRTHDAAVLAFFAGLQAVLIYSLIPGYRD